MKLRTSRDVDDKMGLFESLERRIAVSIQSSSGWSLLSCDETSLSWWEWSLWASPGLKVVSGGSDECENGAKAFTVTNSQHSRTPVTDALLHYHQNTKLGNFFWKNGVSSLYYIAETQRINKSVPCHIFTARWPFSKDYSAEMQVRTQKSNPVVSNINLPAPQYEVDVMFDCIGVRKTKVTVLWVAASCLLPPAHFSQATPSHCEKG